MAKRRVIRIKWHRNRGYWYYQDTDAGVRMTHERKADLIHTARELCRRMWKRGVLAQLVVHGKDGRIKFENTYGKDPRRSKG